MTIRQYPGKDPSRPRRPNYGNLNTNYIANLPGRAYVLDLTSDLDRQREDAVLVLGGLGPELSSQALRALGGDYDLNLDGELSFEEGLAASRLRALAEGLDSDRDGTLSADELRAAGARLVVRGRAYSPESFPLPDGTTGRLARVDPRWHCSWVES